MQNLDSVAKQVRELQAQKRAYELSLSSNQAKLRDVSARHEAASQARLVVQNVAQAMQKNIEEQVSNLVTMALESVFDEPYKFVLEFVQRRNKTECDVWLERGGERISPMDASGGGVIDVASFACRVAFWALKRTAPVLLLDEPMKFVSRSYQPAVGDMMKMLADKLGLQIVMTTHLQDLIEVADNVIEIRGEN